MTQDTKEELQKWKRYEFLFEGTQDMIFYFYKDGTVCERNSSVEELLGFTKDDDMRIQDVLRTCIKIDDDRVILSQSGIDNYFETDMYRKNETCFPVKVRISLLSEETGRYGVCRASSVILQKEANRKLLSAKEEVQEAHKERNEFVANVTHELRTPVNGVMGLAQNLLDTDLTSEQRESIELIEKCCKNMIKIINNILDFSKMSAGKFTIENREFNFHQMMDKLIKVNRPQVEEKGLSLVCNVSDDIPENMIGDELRLTQILNNLVSNAIKFTSVGQVVINVIKSLDMSDEIELFFMVIDSGIGISDEERDKLFKSFSQVDASITRKFGGTGLGLSIVKNLVEMMGGDINVESEKGKGSTFSFTVRLKKVNATEEQSHTHVETNYAFNIGDVPDGDDNDSIFHLGTEENLKEIDLNMEKLVLCIEMENWEKADAFADNVKQLVADDPINLKRKAFRLQMTLRKGVHDVAINEYTVLKEAIDEYKASVAKQ